MFSTFHRFLPRRLPLRTVSIVGTIMAAILTSHAQTDASAWAQVPGILASIIPPTFPTNNFVITDYGAVGDGVTDCTGAISNAIAACNGGGGGRVVVPPGIYLTGAIHLLSDVNLYVSTNATIKFTTNTTAYLPVVFTRDQGVEVMNYSPFIYALQQTNIAITGGGTLDGQAGATSWYNWEASGAEAADFALLEDMAATNEPVAQRIFGAGHSLRPVFIQPCQCQNVLIQGVTLTNSPMWNLNPVYCSNVTIINVTVNEGASPNTDGCDPDSSSDVLIKNCSFTDGDDCSAIKAGRDTDGLRVNIPSQNIVYQNCQMKAGHGGVTIGSETSGGITNVFAENCLMSPSSIDYGLRFKTCPMRGGYIENIYIRNCIIQTVVTAGIQITMQYCTGGTNYPIVRNIDIHDCAFSGFAGGFQPAQPVMIQGLGATNLITDVNIVNCRFATATAASSFSFTNRINLINDRGAGL